MVANGHFSVDYTQYEPYKLYDMGHIIWYGCVCLYLDNDLWLKSISGLDLLKSEKSIRTVSSLFFSICQTELTY